VVILFATLVNEQENLELKLIQFTVWCVSFRVGDISKHLHQHQSKHIVFAVNFFFSWGNVIFWGDLNDFGQNSIVWVIIKGFAKKIEEF